MKLAVIVCANGLGHVIRSMRIINSLFDRIQEIEVSLFCEAWQAEVLESHSESWQFRMGSDVRLIPTRLPVRWSLDQDYYGEWLLDWHTSMATWNLRNFDYVLSDNLVEPLLYADRVTLSGSFFWHDILSSAFVGNKAIKKYRSWCEEVLSSVRPSMVVNRYFAMPATIEQARVYEVGLIPFRRDRDPKRSNPLPTRILVALGNTPLPDPALAELVASVPVLRALGMRVFAPPPWFEALSARCDGLEPYDLWVSNLDGVDLAIIRGGLGTISDCIAARVPVLYLDDPNPEIRFNQARLHEMGIGLPLRGVMRNGSSLFTDARFYGEMLDRMGGFSVRGEIDASDVLAGLWG